MRKPSCAMVAAVAILAWLGGPGGARADFVVNGDFETGDFTGWTLGGNTSDPSTFGVDSSAPYEGSYAAYFGPLGTAATLSQSLTLNPGDTYRLDFWLQGEDGGPTNLSEFSVSFGGSTLETLVNPPAFPYREESFVIVATMAVETLTFSFRNDFAFFDLDKVSVVKVPEPGGFACLAVGAILTVARGWRGRRGGRGTLSTGVRAMRRSGRLPSGRGLASAWILAALLASASGPGEARAQLWAGYGSDPQHTCQSGVASQLPQRVLWSMPVDLNPPFNGNDLFIHYASPLITRKNTVIVTVRSDAGFRVTAVKGGNGQPVWPQPLTTDYALPPHNWYPVCGSTLASGGLSVAVPGAGGTVYLRANPDRGAGAVTQRVFYGAANYNAAKAAFNADVFICTPITADAAGNLYFGFTVLHDTPLASLKQGSGGLARISSTGVGSWITAADATGDANMKKVVYNCAPALSNDGGTVYVAVNNKIDGSSGFGTGYLVALDSATLSKATARKVRLRDAADGTKDALLPDDGSSTPTVGPDGDVYFGVLENPFPNHHDRGWLLHFSDDLATTKTPGSFGWDITASIVPAAAVPSYSGTSSYLLMTKYNNYAGVNGDGHNKLAVLDPNDTQADPINPAVSVMKEVITILGPTPDPEFGGTTVREWCINSAAIDPFNKCAVVNSEDGRMYRWDFTTNTLSSTVALAQATGEAYTPTVIGPDGAVYAINRAVLNCCVKNP